MRPNTLLVAVILCAANAGCGTFWKNTIRNVTEAPIYGVDQCRVSRRNEQLARQAWAQYSGTHAEHADSSDYADGFRTGFADYLESGGNGQPPAVPPFRYRLSRYQTPEGYQAIEEWYAGFRAGSAAARASGLRELYILPLSAPPINAVENRPGTQPGAHGSLSPPGLPALPSDLPPPRVVEPIGPPRPSEPADPPPEVPQQQGEPPG